MDYLFVYGTLMMKYPSNPYKKLLSKHCIEINDATCLGTLFTLGKYPALILGNEIIHGEILTLRDPEPLFAILDDYEGYYPEKKESSYYIRQRHNCVINSHKTFNCWTYIFNKSTTHLKRIESGKFY
jgi:gamma-glutamylcyclotransferase (GGCT)/AIG2-like uncharacterized protein YtfP